MHVHEGGISTPWIVHWPAGIAARNELRTAPVHLMDLPPTVLELAGVPWPKVAKAPPLPGRSIVPLLAKDGPSPHEHLWWNHQGNRAIRAGDWKLVAKGEKGPWELYNLAKDRGECDDLSAAKPDEAKRLEALWTAAWSQFQKDAVIEPPPAKKK
jgi:arylsulfatase